MRYRKLTDSGDYRFGAQGEFYVNQPEAVAQAVLTRLRLWAGEWFPDLREGTDYANGILGYGTDGTRDLLVQERILDTQGVNSIIEYESNVDGSTRAFSVGCTLDTIYGTVTLETVR